MQKAKIIRIKSYMRILFFLFVTLMNLATAGNLPYGKEFIISPIHEKNAKRPRAAAFPQGGFVVVWESAAGYENTPSIMRGQIFDSQQKKVTDFEFGKAYYSDRFMKRRVDVCCLTNGHFVVVWDQKWGAEVEAQLFSETGEPLSGVLQISKSGVWPALVAHPDGGFMIVWSDGSVGRHTVVLAKFDFAGNRISNNIIVKNKEWDDQLNSEIEFLNDCYFMVTLGGRWAQILDKNLRFLGDYFYIDVGKRRSSINDVGFVSSQSGYIFYTAISQSYVDHAAGRFFSFKKPYNTPPFKLSSTNDETRYPGCFAINDTVFVAYWQNYGIDGSGYGIFGRLFHISGKALSKDFCMTQTTRYGQEYAFSTKLANEDILFIWQNQRVEDYGAQVYGRIFPATPRRQLFNNFRITQPIMDTIVDVTQPILMWQSALREEQQCPWEIQYLVEYDDNPEFLSPESLRICNETLFICPPLQKGKSYFFRLTAYNLFGDSLRSNVTAFLISRDAIGLTKEEWLYQPEASIPFEMTLPRDDSNDTDIVINSPVLYQNFPNPFNPGTTIVFGIPTEGVIKLTIKNITGQIVKTYEFLFYAPDLHWLFWDGRDDWGKPVAAGVYFYQLEFKDQNGVRSILTKKMSLLR